MHSDAHQHLHHGVVWSSLAPKPHPVHSPPATHTACTPRIPSFSRDVLAVSPKMGFTSVSALLWAQLKRTTKPTSIPKNFTRLK
jgi:hypothetical protein